MDPTNASSIVTGRVGCFGSATVRRLAQKGAKVVIADVSAERGEALTREVGSFTYRPVARTKAQSPGRSRRAPLRAPTFRIERDGSKPALAGIVDLLVGCKTAHETQRDGLLFQLFRIVLRPGRLPKHT